MVRLRAGVTFGQIMLAQHFYSCIMESRRKQLQPHREEPGQARLAITRWYMTNFDPRRYMNNYKVKVAQHENSTRWAVFIGDGSEWRVYHESGVKSVAAHTASVLRNDAKRLPGLLQNAFEKAASV